MDLVVLSGRIVVQVVVKTGGPGDGTLLPLVAVGEEFVVAYNVTESLFYIYF